MTNKKKMLLVGVVMLALLLLSGCTSDPSAYTKPITGFGVEDIFVYPMAGIMWAIGKSLAFGNYAVVIILSTIVVRTMAWPIYAKTNDMSLKMQLVQPEADKIRSKYEGKEDEASKQRMQMETMQLYKKYGIGLGGCLLPLIQMPIFIGFYRTISRMPATILDGEGNLLTSGHWLRVFTDTKMFGVDLLLGGQTEEPIQKWGVIILAILVGLTQVLSIFLTQKRQKNIKKEQTSTVPAYRLQQQQSTQKQTQTTMNIMMYFMAGMMVLFVLRSPAGLGLYWLVGNIYSTLQSYIGHKTSDKRLTKLKEKH